MLITSLFSQSFCTNPRCVMFTFKLPLSVVTVLQRQEIIWIYIELSMFILAIYKHNWGTSWEFSWNRLPTPQLQDIYNTTLFFSYQVTTVNLLPACSTILPVPTQSRIFLPAPQQRKAAATQAKPLGSFKALHYAEQYTSSVPFLETGRESCW